MDDERTRAAKLALVDLRILVRLYEVEPNFVHLAAAEMLEPAIDSVTVDDAKARLRHLAEIDEVQGLAADYGLAMARLSPLMRQRLEDPAPLMSEREGENWVERIRWLLGEPRSTADLIGARDAVLARPLGLHRAFERN